jgi:hypothetical protein
VATVHPPEEDSPSERRVACAEVNRRRVNEAIERGHGAGRDATFICECGIVGCTAKLRLTIAEYEDVRTDFDRFLLVPGHVVEAVETVAEDHGDYLVAVKHGVAAEVAEDNDPRGDELDRA